ncbi:hypothetical protein DRW48_10440 [Paracoccus suum]|uniref:Uncharacterized protein n=2 Tax=Paracoccus suum TaxID=2259340 RepID=A0A344PKZ7_9RHOB|nr:hypothetical protein DRW48_10440 [Paracoccus suum]
MKVKANDAVSVGDRFHDWVLVATGSKSIWDAWYFLSDSGEKYHYRTAPGFPLTKSQAMAGLRDASESLRRQRCERELALEYARMC